MNQPHYLRVARALTLVLVVPGCTSTQPSPDPQSVVRASDAQPVADAASPPDAGSIDDVDAGHPFSSGPIVPPELPVGFA